MDKPSTSKVSPSTKNGGSPKSIPTKEDFLTSSFKCAKCGNEWIITSKKEFHPSTNCKICGQSTNSSEFVRSHRDFNADCNITALKFDEHFLFSRFSSNGEDDVLNEILHLPFPPNSIVPTKSVQ